MSAPARFAAASAVAASFFFLSLPAVAADLWEPPRGGQAYEDSRYGDVYGEERGEEYSERYSRDDSRDFEPPYRPRASVRDEGYDPPYDPAGRFANGCVPRLLVRDRLREAGWSDFHDLQPRGGVVLVEARRPSGRPFELTIDRCSGAIVEARPLTDGRSYAYGARRYFPRPY
jgi:hypothetical protein